MQGIEFISFNEDNQPQKKVYEGDQIADLLLIEDEKSWPFMNTLINSLHKV